jgi:hypothetical protein
VSRPKVIYHPRPDATPKAGLRALSDSYRFIINCHAKKAAAGGLDDGSKVKGHSADESIIRS